jgi:RNase P/RNase MRP subunit POP5
MAKIVIRGQSQDISREETREVISFFADKLLGQRLSKNIKIFFSFDPKLEDFGLITRLDMAARNARKFSVKIAAQLNRTTALLTIAHEIVHVKQYARGELKDMMTQQSKKWLGEVYDENVAYEDHPWEIEALKMEPLLLQSWLDYKKEYRWKSINYWKL